jgi:amino acid adenylation domain-containing protein
VTTLLHHALNESAARAPAHEAFRCHEASLSYGDLVRRANGLARMLVENGVRPGDRVGIYMHKGIELPVAVYGTLAGGAAYVPIDPAVPLSRAAFIVQDCGIRHLITSSSRERRALDLASQVPALRTVIGARGNERASANAIPWEAVPVSDGAPDVCVRPDDLAYVMYTSGSTGTPKGLMHTHASGMSYVRMSAETYGVRPDDRLGNHSPLHFDMSTFEYLTGPACGATTVIVPEETAMFPLSLAALIERERLTFWYSVPLALVQLLTHGGIESRDCSSLRWVMFGGEPFPPKYLWRLMDLWPQARFSNVYGPAEVNQCTFYHVPREDYGSDAPIPIGRVWNGAEGLVVDADGVEVPAGDTGELVVRTRTMMRGYWGRPDLDARAFLVRDAGEARNVFYRTGDLVRERPDGQLVFLGRRDRQVKVRGYRIELDEVESALAAADAVAEAAAVALPAAEGQLEIVAAVLLRPGATATGDMLRRRAGERLPPYAVPQRVEILSTFPRTGTGKIDRPALAAALAQDTARDRT